MTPRRAIALVAFLASTVLVTAMVTEFSVDAGRLTTNGLGDTRPAAPNTTATGRAQNRRVEVVKQ